MYHLGISMIVPRFTFSTRNFVICSNQVTTLFRSGHDCTSTSSARSPRYFCLQADIAIWVFREVRVDTMLARTLFHFCSRLHGKFMGSVLILRRKVSPWLCRTAFIDKILSEILQPVWQVMQQIALYFFASSIFLFSVSVCLCCRFPRSSSLVVPLLSGTGVSVYLLTSNTESCDEDDA